MPKRRLCAIAAATPVPDARPGARTTAALLILRERETGDHGVGFLAELKRRNVLRTGGLYLVGAWLVVQVASTLLPMFGAPEWLPRSIVVLLALGLIPTLVFAWVYELTPEGLKRESEIDRTRSITPDTGRRIERATLALLAIAVAIFAVDRFVLAPRRAATPAAFSASDAPAAPTVAGAASSSPAPGRCHPHHRSRPLHRRAATGEHEFGQGAGILLRWHQRGTAEPARQGPELRVIARTSSFSFKGKEKPIAEIAHELNVAAVLEGSVRKSGDKVRITVQLIRATDSTHLWSETYDRKLDDIFAVQDEIAAAVVSSSRSSCSARRPKSKPMDPEVFAADAAGEGAGRCGLGGCGARAVALYGRCLRSRRTNLAPGPARATFATTRRSSSECPSMKVSE